MQVVMVVLLSLLPLSGFAAVCLSATGDFFSTSVAAANKYTYLSKDCDQQTVDSLRGDRREAKHLQLYDQQELDGAALSQWRNAVIGPKTTSLQAPPLSARRHPRANLFAQDIQSIAGRFNIDPLLLHAIAYVESRYNPTAVSPAGAKGMMQIMPATARRFGLVGSEDELFDPVVSLRLSSIYLRKLYEMFGNDLPLVLAAYNAGENAVIKYGRKIPPYRETQAYVKKVMKHYLDLRA